MIYNRLGSSGLQISRLSFGAWLTFGQQINYKTSEKLMHTAYEAGVNFFDNAEVYGDGKAEEVMGEILASSGWDRSTFVVSSKVFWGGQLPNQKGLSRKHIREACDAALKRLQVDYLDLFYCHRPDRNTPIEETVRAMSALVDQGKILYWGTSEWSAAEYAEAYFTARQYNLVPPSMEQPQYNLFHRQKVEADYERLYETTGMGTTIWSPLASGLLTGKYNSGKAPEDTRANLPGMEWLKEKLVGEEVKDKIPKVQQLAKLAEKLDTNLPCLAIAWCLNNPNVSSVILGASKVEQLENNVKALEVYEQLTPEIIDEIETIVQNKPKLTYF
jgi:voltage-dependent potassium channel beta subunit